MKYPPSEARCVFIDGPVAIYVSQASREAIIDAYANLGRCVRVAALQLGEKECMPKAVTAQSQQASCWSARLGEITRSAQAYHSKERLGKN